MPKIKFSLILSAVIVSLMLGTAVSAQVGIGPGGIDIPEVGVKVGPNGVVTPKTTVNGDGIEVPDAGVKINKDGVRAGSVSIDGDGVRANGVSISSTTIKINGKVIQILKEGVGDFSTTTASEFKDLISAQIKNKVTAKIAEAMGNFRGLAMRGFGQSVVSLDNAIAKTDSLIAKLEANGLNLSDAKIALGAEKDAEIQLKDSIIALQNQIDTMITNGTITKNFLTEANTAKTDIQNQIKDIHTKMTEILKEIRTEISKMPAKTQ